MLFDFAPCTFKGCPSCYQPLVGLLADTRFWPGVIGAERLARVTAALRSTSQIVVGSAIAGAVVGCASLGLHMEALWQIGLAIFCAAMTLMPATLGALPISPPRVDSSKDCLLDHQGKLREIRNVCIFVGPRRKCQKCPQKGSGCLLLLITTL